MKKPILLLYLALMFLVIFQVSLVSAATSGYERMKDNDFEAYLEYLPIVPYNPSYPTASEEFPIKFHLWQRAWLHGPWWDIQKMVPRLFKIKVYYRDDSCGSSNYVTWKRWYPSSASQYGLTITWALSGALGPLTLSGSVNGPDVFGYSTNYDKYYESYGGKSYLHVGDLQAEYRSNLFWGNVDVYGGGSIGIPNSAAASHKGHHVLIWVQVILVWLNMDWKGEPLYLECRYYNFVFGDDIPWDTDCWITVQQGDTNFSVS